MTTQLSAPAGAWASGTGSPCRLSASALRGGWRRRPEAAALGPAPLLAKPWGLRSLSSSGHPWLFKSPRVGFSCWGRGTHLMCCLSALALRRPQFCFISGALKEPSGSNLLPLPAGGGGDVLCVTFLSTDARVVMRTEGTCDTWHRGPAHSVAVALCLCL